MPKSSDHWKTHISASKHLFFISNQTILVLLCSAALIQFIVAWSSMEQVTLVMRGVLFILSLLVYLFSKVHKGHDLNKTLVLVCFSTFIFYRVFVENIFHNLAMITRYSHLNTYWVILVFFVCTGISVRTLVSICLVSFVGLMFGLQVADSWHYWAIDIPIFLAYFVLGLSLYYIFFCIGTEICRMHRKPLIALRDLPDQFFSELEPDGLSCLPLNVLTKRLKREDHLYILLKVTEVPGKTREWALALIGEERNFEFTLQNTDRLIYRLLRTFLLSTHIRQSNNPALRNMEAAITQELERSSGSSSSSSSSQVNLSDDRKDEEITRRLKAQPVAAAPSLDFPIKRMRQFISLNVATKYGHRLADAEHDEDADDIHDDDDDDDDDDDASSTDHEPPFRKAAIRTLKSEFRGESINNFNKEMAGSIYNRANQQRPDLPLASSSSSSIGNLKLLIENKSDVSLPMGQSFRRKGSWLQQPNDSKRPVNSVHTILARRLQNYDSLLAKVNNRVWDPIRFKMEGRLGLLNIPLIGSKLSWLRRLVTLVQGLEAVMVTAQWKQGKTRLPKSNKLGRFVDSKIERWYLSWVASVQARQYILMSFLNTLLVLVIIAVTWDFLIFEALVSNASSAVRNTIIYLAFRTPIHLLAAYVVHRQQKFSNYSTPDSAHYFKRRATFLSFLGLMLSILDTLMHQVLIHGRLLTYDLIILSSTVFTICSHLTLSSILCVAVLLDLIVICLAPLYSKLGIDTRFLLIFGLTVWMIFLSRCISLNYRLLFGRYVVPYLLYLNALQLPKNFSKRDDSLSYISDYCSTENDWTVAEESD